MFLCKANGGVGISSVVRNRKEKRVSDLEKKGNFASPSPPPPPSLIRIVLGLVGFFLYKDIYISVYVYVTYVLLEGKD